MRSCSSASRRQRSSVSRASRCRRARRRRRARAGAIAPGVAHPVQDLAEQRARLGQLRVELERALERALRVGVPPLEEGGDAGAEVQARVLRVGGERAAEGSAAARALPRVQRVPAALLEQRRPRIDLRRRRSDRAAPGPAASAANMTHVIRLYSQHHACTPPIPAVDHEAVIERAEGREPAGPIEPTLEQRSRRRSRVRLAADHGNDRGARGPLRHLDAARRGAGRRGRWRRSSRGSTRARRGRGHADLVIGSAVADAAARRLPRGAAAERRGVTCSWTGASRRRRSYAEMSDASLRVRRGVPRDGPASAAISSRLIVDDAEQFLTALFGASIAGLVPASLYPPGDRDRSPRYLDATAGILRAARARAVVTTPRARRRDGRRCATRCPDVACVIAMRRLERATSTASRADVRLRHERAHAGASLDDIAFVQFTSGSTSRPKASRSRIAVWPRTSTPSTARGPRRRRRPTRR